MSETDCTPFVVKLALEEPLHIIYFDRLPGDRILKDDEPVETLTMEAGETFEALWDTTLEVGSRILFPVHSAESSLNNNIPWVYSAVNRMEVPCVVLAAAQAQAVAQADAEQAESAPGEPQAE